MLFVWGRVDGYRETLSTSDTFSFQAEFIQNIRYFWTKQKKNHKNLNEFVKIFKLKGLEKGFCISLSIRDIDDCQAPSFA